MKVDPDYIENQRSAGIKDIMNELFLFGDSVPLSSFKRDEYKNYFNVSDGEGSDEDELQEDELS